MVEYQEYDDEYLKRFIKLKHEDNYDPLKYWYPKINPNIKGLPRARKIALLCLASGEFGTNMRDRLHILLLGEPGTGKTRIRDFIIQDIGEHINETYMGTGSGSKRAALTYNANRDEVGMLHKANGGVIAIDELDEVGSDARGSLLEAMSEGKYEVSKGKYSDGKKFEAKVRVIGTANSINNFRPEFLDRWDFVLQFEKPDSEKEDRIVSHTYQQAYSKTDQTAKEVANYIKFIRSCHVKPEDMDRNIQLVSNLIEVLRDKVQNEEQYKRRYSDVRKKQSLLRTALSIARLNTEPQKPKHYLKSIKLHYPELKKEEIKTIWDR